MTKRIFVCNDKDLEVFIRSQDKLTIVEFWDPWCSICAEMAPIFSKLAKKYEGRAVFSKLNMRENEESPKRYQVYVTPTFIFFMGGKEIKRMGGLLGANELDNAIKECLEKTQNN
ncbi:MAG: thioredoxin [Candidatus Methanomethyliaceae archaeon]|nr:thioredoxin [Candidatus Methanomethyliaceae archaeon]